MEQCIQIELEKSLNFLAMNKRRMEFSDKIHISKLKLEPTTFEDANNKIQLMEFMWC